MKKSRNSITYKDAGVDINAADKLKRRIAALVKSTETPDTLGSIGLFGGTIDISRHLHKNLALVASVDGVGTKTVIAKMFGRYTTIGIDIVSHCVNDILSQGARPLFFMDYYAASKLVPDMVAHIIEGIAKACKENDCVLLGGETAEMPGIYQDGAFDLVGVIVGIVERDKFIDGSSIKEGDTLIGLASSGLHTNGYSLARKILLEKENLDLSKQVGNMQRPLGDELLEPHKSYLQPILKLQSNDVIIKGIAHITGGGIPGNLSRIIPDGLSAVVTLRDIPRLLIFELIKKLGNVPDEEMLRTFNMGVGLIICVDKSDADNAMRGLASSGQKAYLIGSIDRGSKKVIIK